MADEIRITASLQVRKNNLTYQSQPTSFTADMTGEKGPTPGAISVTTAGVDVTFSELTVPGVVRIHNVSSERRVTWGVHDGAVFHPVGDLLPGEVAVFRLSQDLGEEHVTAGTGTTGTVNTFHLKAWGGTAVVIIDAFES